MSTRLVLATHNDAKVAELREILEGLDVELVSAGVVHLPDVEETGATFAENALLKVRAGVSASGLPCIADDSGLVVDVLDGAPGVHSARYAALYGPPEVGAPSSDRTTVDQANLRLVLLRLAGIPPSQRTARFTCAAALALPDGTDHVVESDMEGTVLDEPRGTAGFGYDPLFVPVGETRTTAEMTAAEKHAISHRGKAFRLLRPLILRYVATVD